MDSFKNENQIPKSTAITEEIERVVLDNAPLAIYIFQEGRLVFFNTAFVELSGYERDELSTIDYVSLIHCDFREAFIKQTEMALAGLISELTREPEIKIIRKNGDVRWMQIKPRIIEYAGKPAILGMVSDITERKNSEESLRESETRYRLLAENLTDATWVINVGDPNSLDYISPSVSKLLGYTVEEAKSKRMDQILTPTSFKMAKDILAEVSLAPENVTDKQHEPLCLELELVRKDGSKVPVEATYSVMKGAQAQPPSILIVARDLTQRKALEAERLDIEQKAQYFRRMAAIGEMAAGIAHEINNPLTSVIGFCELLLHREVPGPIRKDLEIIYQGANRISSIVKRLSIFSKKSRPLLSRVHVNELVENALNLRAYHLRTAGIEVEADLDPGLPETLADRGQLEEVFLNIIANAETELSLAHGKGKLRVTTRKHGNNIQIAFQDNGGGVPAENIEKIFQPFFSTRPTGTGSGLGLSTCSNIITEHGGRIWAESEFGNGATFFVEIPITRKREAVVGAGQKEKRLGQTPIAKVLVTDDEPSVREYLNRALTELGYQVECAEDSYKALSLIKDSSYDVIIIDAKMPSLSGFDLYQKLNEADAKELIKKVIFITADMLGDATSAFVAQNEIPIIAKPIDLVDLNRKMTAILSSSEAIS